MSRKLNDYSTGIGIVIGGGAGYLVGALTNISIGITVVLGAIIGMLIGITR